jgi:SAM-dependent methyltransferase
MKTKLLNSLDQLKKQLLFLQNSTQINHGFKSVITQVFREIKAQESYLLHYESSLRNVSKFKNLYKLQIGGGSHYLAGFVNLDLFSPSDIIWDCRLGLPFNDSSFEYIFSEHFLEHIDYPYSVQLVLSEIYRVMKEGGELFISIPDGGKILDAYNRKDDAFFEKLYLECYSNRNPTVEINGLIDYVNYLFRDQIENPKYTVHHWAFDQESLTKLLNDAGFKTVKKVYIHPQYSNPDREFYSLYISAIK